MGELTDEELMELQQKGAAKDALINPPRAVSGVVTQALPEWAKMPPDLKLPRGKVLAFMKFEPETTDAPDKGVRQAVLWSLSVRDERFARQRTFGEPSRIYEEMTKGMIRAIDGLKVEGDPGAVESFWDEIGPKNRSILTTWYHSQHGVTEVDRLRFFASCVATRTAG